MDREVTPKNQKTYALLYNGFVEFATIRPFQPKDRPALFRIAGDTAFFGAPIEAFLDDRRVFNDIFYRYYTDFEPEHAWVAEVDRHVVGFLTGCVDSRRQDGLVRRSLLPDLLRGILRRQYIVGRKTIRYAVGLGFSVVRGEVPPADPDQYPAHLHINIDPACRGFGLGRRLIAAYLDQLQNLGVSGVHLHTTNINRAACALYERMGFVLAGERPTSTWANLVEEPVFNRLYTRRISIVEEPPSGRPPI